MSVRDIFKTILSIILIIAGLCGFFMIFLLTRDRMAAVANSKVLMIAADVMIFISALIMLISGLHALSHRSPRRVVRVRPFIQIGVIVAVIQCIISSINGIRIDYLLIVAAALVVVPEIFFLLIAFLMARK